METRSGHRKPLSRIAVTLFLFTLLYLILKSNHRKEPIIKTVCSHLGRAKKMAEMTIVPVAAPVATHGFLVDGRWMEDGDIVEVRSPYDGSVVGRVVQARREHAEAAIAAAVKAFGTTRRLPAFERQRVLRRVAGAIAERREEFSRTIVQEAGKPI